MTELLEQLGFGLSDGAIVSVGLSVFAVLALVWWLGTKLVWIRKWPAFFIRVVLVLLLLLSLAGLSSVRRVDQVALVAVLDVSGSMRLLAPKVPVVRAQSDGTSVQSQVPFTTRAAELIALRAAEKKPEDLFGAVAFAGQGQTVIAPRSGGVVSQAEPKQGEPAPKINLANMLLEQRADGTDLAGAIELALASVPESATGRLLVVSDGLATKGDVLAAARLAASRGVVIDVVPAVYKVEREVMVTEVDAPLRAPPGSQVPLRVVLDATTAGRGLLRLVQEGQEVDINGASAGLGQEVNLTVGRNVITLGAQLSLGRVHRFEVIYEPFAPAEGQLVSDTSSENNRGLAVTMSPGAGKVLVLDGGSAEDRQGSDVLAAMLREGRLDTTVISATAAPSNLLAWQEYDLVILQNLAAEVMSEESLTQLRQYVTDFGGGLLMTGGVQSFGAGGWKATPIEPILPVTLDVPERLVLPTAAVVLIIDSSGSMGRGVSGTDRNQQQIANQGAVAALRTLDVRDLVGVIRFDNRAEWVVDLQANNKPAETAEAILDIAPSGGTNLPPAMEMAFDSLARTQAQVKHVIVLSDGLSQGRERLGALARRYEQAGIKLSAVAIGDAADASGLEALARVGGGEFFQVVDPTILPRVLIKAVRVMRTPLVREQPFVPMAATTASPLVAGFAGENVPALGGLNLSQAKISSDQKQVEGVNYILISPEGEPVLATWQAGLGQAGAFTSDFHRWGQGWSQWPAGRVFAAQLAKSLARSSEASGLELVATADQSRAEVRLEAVDDRGRPIDGLQVAASVFSPRGEQVNLSMQQTGPGLYSAGAAVRESGIYIVTAAVSSGGGQGKTGSTGAPVVGGIVVPPGQELRTLAADGAMLREVAKITGGREISLAELEQMTSQSLYLRDTIEKRESRQPLWPILVAIAAGVFVLDVASRRVAWERLTDRASRREMLEAARKRTESAASSVQRLKKTTVEAGVRADEQVRSQPSVREPVMVRRPTFVRRAAEEVKPEAGGAEGAAEGAVMPAVKEEEAGSGLLAAKKRARARMEEK